ncbi:MAG: restriction endonuclease subunit S [Terriglobales bacterium]
MPRLLHEKRRRLSSKGLKAPDMQRNRNLSGCQIFKATDLPVGWDCVPIGDRIELAYGRALREGDRKSGYVDVYGSNGRIGTHSVALVNGPGVLVGRKGTVGAVHFAEHSFWAIDTVYYVVPRGKDDIRYLHHLLEYLPLGFLNAATGVPGLSRRDAYALRGAFPSPGEQVAIARVLDAVNTALECTRATVEMARELRTSLIRELLERGIRNEQLRKASVGLLPASWDCKPLGEYLLDGPTNGVYRPQSDYVAHGTPIVRIDDFADGTIHNIGTLQRVKVETVIERRYALEKQDILINRVNSLSHIGKAGLVPDLEQATIFESNMMRLRCNPHLLPAFLVTVLCSDIARKHWLSRAKPAVNQASINQRDVRELLIPVPEPDEQRDIALIVSSANRQIEAMLAVADGYHRLKRSLLADLLTGRVRVGGLAEVTHQ